MDSGTVMQIIFATFMISVKLLTPMLATAVVIGLVISLFQAVTQIHDTTLTFLPKLVGVALVMWLTWPWMVQEMVSYTTHTFELMEHLNR